MNFQSTMRDRWQCIEMQCSYFDGEYCMLGTGCKPHNPGMPDVEIKFNQYLKWDRENYHKFEKTIYFDEWLEWQDDR